MQLRKYVSMFKEQWGFKEADRNSAEYKFMYKQIKHDMNSEINLFLYDA